MENIRVTRTVLVELCKVLGHDADRVSSINVYPDHVSVTYDHFVTDIVSDDPVGTIASPTVF
jgi:hypothetical protein